MGGVYLLGKKIKRGRGIGNFGKKMKNRKRWGWGRISSCRELYSICMCSQQSHKKLYTSTAIIKKRLYFKSFILGFPIMRKTLKST